jgi:hypothetical protein
MFDRLKFPGRDRKEGFRLVPIGARRPEDFAGIDFLLGNVGELWKYAADLSVIRTCHEIASLRPQ